GIVGEVPGLVVELADIDDLGADRAFDDGQLERFAGCIVGQRHRASRSHDIGVVAVHRRTTIVSPGCRWTGAVAASGAESAAVAALSNAVRILQCNIANARTQAEPLAASVMRPRLSSWPSASMTSKIPGDAVEPVRAARSGCATAPNLTFLLSAKSRSRCSSTSACHSVPLRPAANSPSRCR